MSTRFRALDGWRGICALLVAAHHFEARGFLYWQPLIRNAWLFVDFFFVLSGFVIAHAYGEALATAPQVRAFALRRLGRLWPLHVAMLAALVVVEFSRLALEHRFPLVGARAAFTGANSPIAILSNLLLLQGLGVHDRLTWNGPAWSISTEFYTYLVFALVCLSARGHALRAALSLLLAVGGVVILARFSRYGMRETFGWGFFRCLYGFFSGALIYDVWRRGIVKQLSGSIAEAFILAAIVAFITLAPGNRVAEYFATPLFALAVLVFAAEGGVLSRALTTRPAAALGSWSYSIYMVHTLVLALSFSAIHTAELAFHRVWLVHLKNGDAALALGSWNDPVMLIFLAAVVALSAFTWRVIERPGQHLFNQLAAP